MGASTWNTKRWPYMFRLSHVSTLFAPIVTKFCVIRLSILGCPSHHVNTSQKHGPMNAISRREEDALLKGVKAKALKECAPVVKGMSQWVLSMNVH